MTKAAAPNPQQGVGGGTSKPGTDSADAMAAKQFDFNNAGGVSIFSGAGVPSGATYGNGVAASAGDLYIRSDGGGAGSTHVYVCTVGGGSPTWLGIA